MIIWLYEYMCYMCCICVVLCEIVSVVICMLCVMYMVILVMRVQCAWYDDLRLIYTCVIWSYNGVIYTDFRRAAWLEFLYVVLNTTCDCIWCYVMCIVVLYYTVMCVYVDNYVDNFNINVDNFLLHLQHFYELFWKCCVFVYFRTLSLAISYLLLFSHFFIIS